MSEVEAKEGSGEADVSTPSQADPARPDRPGRNDRDPDRSIQVRKRGGPMK
jgi:hypothetical protein